MTAEWTRQQLEQELRTAVYLLDRLETELIVAYSYTSRPLGDVTEMRLDQAKELVRRVNENAPPEPLTEEAMQRAHESIMAAFDQRENRERILELELENAQLRAEEQT